jgi:hypothetical protein
MLLGTNMTMNSLPRKGSFDSFKPKHFHEELDDFRAILAGRENPQGYFV